MLAARGWSDANTVNCIEPQPISSRSDNGRVAIEYAPLAVGTFSVLAIATSWLSHRFRSLRKVLEASPLVVVEHGATVDHNMRAERLTLEEIASAARLQQIGSLDDVEWAIVEGNGQISFIPRRSEA